MKNITIIFLAIFFYSNLFGQDNIEIRAVLNKTTNQLTIEARNTTSSNPTTGFELSTLGFELSGRAKILSRASSNYNLPLPSASNLVLMPVPTASPVDWAQNVFVPLVVYNVDPTSVITDFVITPDSDGDMSDLNDPTLSGASLELFNRIMSVSATVLPIKLRSFTADQYGDVRASLLNWVSSSEINGSHFEIERSIDAQTWAKIGTVNAVGNTSTDVAYEFLDRTIDHARGQDVFYYRLNKVDLDGSSEYTDIRTVRFDPVAEVSVNIYPTLTTGLVRVELASPAGTAPSADAVLFDKVGRIINKQEVSTNGITELDLAKYGNGQYFIKMEVNKKVYTTQVIKVN
jgi:hypothetical protein